MKKASCCKDVTPIGVLAMILCAGMPVLGEEASASFDAVDTNAVSAIVTNATLSETLPSVDEPNSAYSELVRLVQAGVDQGVILSYVENSLRFFNLDADKIIYLTDLGAPSEIIEATMEHDKKLFQKGISAAAEPSTESIETAANPPSVITTNDFYDALAPYGGWIYVEGYGRCWRPTVVMYNADWRPYCDNGRWVYSDCGWYWMSDYSWGWATFHYGRWFRDNRYGWCWWPDTVWSPSWVCWRYDRDYCGWAPLPPHTSCRSGVGIVYRGNRVNVGFNFGLSYDCYTFISTKNFCDPKPWHHRVDSRDAENIYNRTKVFNRMDYDARRKSVVNGGISPNVISTLTRQDIDPVSIRHAKSPAGSNNRHEQLNRSTRTLVVSRPEHTAQYSKQVTMPRSGNDQRVGTQSRSSSVTSGRNYSSSSPRSVSTPDVRVRPSTPSQNRQTPPRSTVPQTRQPRSPVIPQQPQTRSPTASQQGHQRQYTPPASPSRHAAPDQSSRPAQSQVNRSTPDNPRQKVSPPAKSNNPSQANRSSGNKRTDLADTKR